MLKLDGLTELELSCYEEWNSADDQGGDCQGIGYAWAAWRPAIDGTEPGVIIIKDDQGFVDAESYETDYAFDTQVKTLQAADNAFNAEDEERDEAIREAQDALDNAMAEDEGRCDSCEVAYINGVRCHEHGCPRFARIQALKKRVDALEND